MTDTAVLIKDLVTSIRKFSKGDIYLFGSTLRNFLLCGVGPSLDVVVNEKDKQVQRKILESVTVHTAVNFIFNADVDYSHEFYTIDNIYAHVDENFDGNLEIQSTNNGLVDLNKRIVKLTKAGKERVKDTPEFILDTITFVAENKFILDAGAISAFMQHKASVKTCSPARLYKFVTSIVSYEHPRKVISLINTLGISKELFNIKLTETSAVNHLRAEDYCEMVAIVFSDLEKNEFRRALVGFPPREIDAIKNISTALGLIESEDEVTARNILKTINGFRIQNMIRLLYALKFKTLAKLVRSQKECAFSLNKLCIDEETIRATFKIDDEEKIKKILDKALQKVILEPEFNEKYKILSYLNTERE
jgi:tRNA nucleotidyltransferase/poly(A) polymerase